MSKLKPLAKFDPNDGEDEGPIDCDLDDEELRVRVSEKPTTRTGMALRTLWNSIHRWKPPEHARDFGIYTETRSLIDSEWRYVQRAIDKGYPATIVPHGWMEGFALVVYEPVEPIYPGVILEPLPVFQLVSTQLPGNGRNRQKQRYSTKVSNVPGGAWELFSQICGTPENLAALKREGIDPPKSIGHYQY